jgi:hypothetical protein
VVSARGVGVVLGRLVSPARVGAGRRRVAGGLSCPVQLCGIPFPGGAGVRNLPSLAGRGRGRELLIVCRHKAPGLVERARDREVSHPPAGRSALLTRAVRPAETNPPRSERGAGYGVTARARRPAERRRGGAAGVQGFVLEPRFPLTPRRGAPPASPVIRPKPGRSRVRHAVVSTATAPPTPPPSPARPAAPPRGGG